MDIKKNILLILLTLLLIIMLGCGNEGLNDSDNQEFNEVEKIDEIEAVEVVEVPDTEFKVNSIKIEELGEFTPIRKMRSKNITDENAVFRIKITDYTLSEIKLNDEYKTFFEEQDEITILNIIFDFENLSNDILELDLLQGSLRTNTGEEIPVILEFFEESNQNKLKFYGNEVKKGTVSAILDSNPKEIDSCEFIYDDSIILEIDFKEN